MRRLRPYKFYDSMERQWRKYVKLQKRVQLSEADTPTGLARPNLTLPASPANTQIFKRRRFLWWNSENL